MEFNLKKGQGARDRGVATASEKRRELLNIARILARQIALHHPERICHIDLVHKALKKRRSGYRPEHLGNAAGAVFRGANWQQMGWLNSERLTNHSRAVRLWKYVGYG